VLLPESPVQSSDPENVVVVPVGPEGAGAVDDAATGTEELPAATGTELAAAAEVAGAATELAAAGTLTGVLVDPTGAAAELAATPPPKVAQVLKSATEVLKRGNWLGNLSSGSLTPPKALNSASRPTSIVAPRSALGLSQTPPAVFLFTKSQ